jgi:hypothetical protein
MVQCEAITDDWRPMSEENAFSRTPLLCGQTLSPTFSGCASLVTVMESTCGVATIRPSSGGCTARGSGESLASKRCVLDPIICRECFYVPVQRGFAEDDHMIEARAPNRTDHALDVGPVPRGSRCTKHLLHVHVVDLSSEVVTEDSIPISQQIAWCRVPRESIAQLLGGPFRGRMSRNVEVQYSPPLMGQHQEYVTEPGSEWWAR